MPNCLHEVFATYEIRNTIGDTQVTNDEKIYTDHVYRCTSIERDGDSSCLHLRGRYDTVVCRFFRSRGDSFGSGLWAYEGEEVE